MDTPATKVGRFTVDMKDGLVMLEDRSMTITLTPKEAFDVGMWLCSMGIALNDGTTFPMPESAPGQPS